MRVLSTNGLMSIEEPVFEPRVGADSIEIAPTLAAEVEVIGPKK